MSAYRQMVEAVWKRLTPVYPTVVFFSPDDAEADMRQWLGSHADYFPQGGGNLGDRLKRGSAHLFARGVSKLIILGGDCPYVDRFVADAAFNALDHVDMVIAPAHDGGYTLLGLRRHVTALFEDIDWGTSSVYDTTMAQARQAGLSIKTLEPMDDVDDLASWERVQRYLGV